MNGENAGNGVLCFQTDSTPYQNFVHFCLDPSSALLIATPLYLTLDSENRLKPAFIAGRD